LKYQLTDNVLTIKGETKAEEEVKEANYHLRERRYGSFARSISLGSRITADKIQANYENGILTLHLPKAEEVKPKRIAIKPSKMIEAKNK
jgi:HSP20 family protein